MEGILKTNIAVIAFIALTGSVNTSMSTWSLGKLYHAVNLQT